MSHEDKIYKALMRAVTIAFENQRPLIKQATSIVEEIHRTDDHKELSEAEMLEVDNKARKYVTLLRIANAYAIAINVCAYRVGINYMAN